MVPYCTFMLSTGGKIWRSAALIGPSRNVGELWTRVTWKKRSPPSQRRPLTHPSWPPCFEAFPTGGTNTVALIASLPRIHYVRRFEDPIWGETTPTSSPPPRSRVISYLADNCLEPDRGTQYRPRSKDLSLVWLLSSVCQACLRASADFGKRRERILNKIK